ncbi:MAG: RMD1 family protein [Waddliaceae bacterium]
MICWTICCAEGFELEQLKEHLDKQYKCRLYDHVIHVEVKENQLPKQLFYFRYGVIVFWGISKQQHQKYLDLALQFARGKLDENVEDEFVYAYGDLSKIKEKCIILPDHELLTKLAVSHAMAQSAKLEVFEIRIEKTIQEMQPIPLQLAKTGRQPFSSLQLRRKMGKLYVDKSSINLHFDLLDVPDFFWDYEELEPIYSLTANYLDIKDRVDILNQKLHVMSELYEMLSEELKHRHSSRLEWIIIVLITIEVVVVLSKDILKIL